MNVPIFLADASGEVHTGWLTGVLLNFARGGAEWILWLLVFLSVGSFIVFFERLAFYRKTATNVERLRRNLMDNLPAGNVDEALRALKDDPSMEARVVAYGLRDAEKGPKAVEELCRGALGMEKLRFERGLTVLATIGSNAPFIGLFGTVMGVIMAFDNLSGSAGADPSGQAAVMGAIAEALIATGVGLLVAIPAIIFFNVLKGQVKKRSSSTVLLVETMLAYLHDNCSQGAE